MARPSAISTATTCSMASLLLRDLHLWLTSIVCVVAYSHQSRQNNRPIVQLDHEPSGGRVRAGRESLGGISSISPVFWPQTEVSPPGSVGKLTAARTWTTVFFFFLFLPRSSKSPFSQLPPRPSIAASVDPVRQSTLLLRSGRPLPLPRHRHKLPDLDANQ